MVMKAVYDIGSHLAGSHFDANSTQANKALAKVASGQKFQGAHDDSASYAISEKMRAQIRSLFQNDQNIQNGSSLIRTAERAIDQIVQELSSLKELAINAANDSNTAQDRLAIQKEFDSRRATINELVQDTQYNGKILLDGRWARDPAAKIKLDDIVGGFTASTNAKSNLVVEPRTKSNANSSTWSFEVDKSFINVSSGAFSVELNFDALPKKADYPDDLNGQGFTILCGGCPQYINIIFDAEKSASESTYNSSPTPPAGMGANNLARELVIGVKDVTSRNNLAEAIFAGVTAVKNEISTNNASQTNKLLLDSKHNLSIERNGNKILLTKDSLAMQFKNGILGEEEEEDEVKKLNTAPLWIQFGTEANQRTQFFIEDLSTDALTAGKIFKKKFSGDTVNTGNFIYKSDRERYLALSNDTAKQTEWIKTLKAAEKKTVDDISVTTKENANVAIRVLDGALDYTLNEATSMGAYIQRLEHAYTNTITMRENAQASESTIRDTDMAKEITNYSKYNLLTKSSQAMLAMANQEHASILTFLQQPTEDE